VGDPILPEQRRVQERGAREDRREADRRRGAIAHVRLEVPEIEADDADLAEQRRRVAGHGVPEIVRLVEA
jgi:hypothetical protein